MFFLPLLFLALCKDSTGKSKGTAVFEYTDLECGQLALTGLSGLSVGKGKLMVQRVPAMMAATLLKPVKVSERPFKARFFCGI